MLSIGSKRGSYLSGLRFKLDIFLYALAEILAFPGWYLTLVSYVYTSNFFVYLVATFGFVEQKIAARRVK